MKKRNSLVIKLKKVGVPLLHMKKRSSLVIKLNKVGAPLLQ